MELKRCPFCGEAETSILISSFDGYWYAVVCDNCMAHTRKCRRKEDAMEAWNRRAEPKRAHWIVYGNWRECSHCHEASKLSVMEHKDYCPACGARMIEEVETNG